MICVAPYVFRRLVASGPVCLQCGVRRQGEAHRVVLQHWLGCLSPLRNCICLLHSRWHCETAVQAWHTRRRCRLPTSSASWEHRDAEQWQWWWRWPWSVNTLHIPWLIKLLCPSLIEPYSLCMQNHPHVWVCIYCMCWWSMLYWKQEVAERLRVFYYGTPVLYGALGCL